MFLIFKNYFEKYYHSKNCLEHWNYSFYLFCCFNQSVLQPFSSVQFVREEKGFIFFSVGVRNWGASLCINMKSLVLHRLLRMLSSVWFVLLSRSQAGHYINHLYRKKTIVSDLWWTVCSTIYSVSSFSFLCRDTCVCINLFARTCRHDQFLE